MCKLAKHGTWRVYKKWEGYKNNKLRVIHQPIKILLVEFVELLIMQKSFHRIIHTCIHVNIIFLCKSTDGAYIHMWHHLLSIIEKCSETWLGYGCVQCNWKSLCCKSTFWSLLLHMLLEWVLWQDPKCTAETAAPRPFPGSTGTQVRCYHITDRSLTRILLTEGVVSMNGGP